MARLLFIDTDEKYARFLCSKLVEAGHHCIHRSSGADIINLLDRHEIDLVISEAMLPDLSGFGICRRIRSHEQHFLTPLIILSTMAEEAELAHGYAQGVDIYLAKPVDPRILIESVNSKLAEVTSDEIDHLTGLFNAKRIKSTMQRAHLKRDLFAILYIEMLSLVQFTQSYGQEARDKALRGMARLLKHLGEKTGDLMFEAGHMGGGHFICLVSQSEAVKFSKTIVDEWDKHLPKLITRVPGKNASAANGANSAALSLIVCVTGGGRDGVYSIQDYFETLAHLRSKAQEAGKGGIFLDLRRQF
ncbi:MAG: response regulator [Candidatus Hydrogenedentales bacterium]